MVKRYGLAMFNGRIVGVSPGYFGDDSLHSVAFFQKVSVKATLVRDAILAAGKPLQYRQTPDYFPGAVDEQVGVAPPPEPTDEERAAAAGSNIVYDDSGNPVKVEGTDDYVTTQSGQYVSQAELQRQNQAKQAAMPSAAEEQGLRKTQHEERTVTTIPRRNDYGCGSSNPVALYWRGIWWPRWQCCPRTGFVEGSPDNYTKAQTVADDENRQVRVGSFVLNAPTTEKLQKAGVFPKGVDNSDKNTTIKANKGGMMDVALSKGEYVLEPEEAKQIGYDTLNKINDRQTRGGPSSGPYRGGVGTTGTLRTQWSL